MIYAFVFVALYAGLVHEVQTTGFETEEACYEYAAGALTAFDAMGYKVLAAECKLLETGA